MDYKVQPYLKNLNNLSDARFAASEAFYAVGFEMQSGSENFIGFDKVKEIADWISGPLKVGVFNLEIPIVINDTILRCGLEAVEVSGNTSLSEIQEISTDVILRINDADLETFDIEKIKASSGLLVVVNEKEQKHLELLNERLKPLLERTDVILDIGKDIQDQKRMLDTTFPFGIVMQGGAEILVGLRAFEELEDSLTILRY